MRTKMVKIYQEFNNRVQTEVELSAHLLADTAAFFMWEQSMESKFKKYDEFSVASATHRWFIWSFGLFIRLQKPAWRKNWTKSKTNSNNMIRDNAFWIWQKKQQNIHTMEPVRLQFIGTNDSSPTYGEQKLIASSELDTPEFDSNIEPSATNIHCFFWWRVVKTSPTCITIATTSNSLHDERTTCNWCHTKYGKKIKYWPLEN